MVNNFGVGSAMVFRFRDCEIGSFSVCASNLDRQLREFGIHSNEYLRTRHFLLRGKFANVINQL